MKSKSTNFRFKQEFYLQIKNAAHASGSTLTAWVVAACLEKLTRDRRRANRV